MDFVRGEHDGDHHTLPRHVRPSEAGAHDRTPGFLCGSGRVRRFQVLVRIHPVIAVLISIPPLNAIIHGTYAVTGDAMGATIGIDTMVLIGAIIWILGEHLVAREGEEAASVLNTEVMRRIVVGLNLRVAALVGWLHLSGTITGISRAGFAPGEVYVPPTWLPMWNRRLVAATGFIALVFFLALLWKLIPLAFRYWWVSEIRA